MNKFIQAVAAGAAVFSLANAADAASFNFGFIFDGTDVALDGGSDTPHGTSLNLGDDFSIDFKSAGNDFWKVDNLYSVFVPLSFAVDDARTRTATISTTWLQDGIVQDSRNETLDQSTVHVGAQDWDLAAGLMFDQVVMSWTFDAIDSPGSTTISALGADFFNGFGQSGVAPFFRADDISYVSAAVPVPASLPLLAGAIGLLAFGRRRRA